MHLTNSSDRLHAYKSKDTTYEQYVYNYCADSYLVKLTLIKGLSPVLKNIRLMQKKDANSNAYELIRQINFYHQENALNASKEQKISDVLPTGHGCRPVHSGENSVPSHSLFGLQGDISFEFVRKETVSKDGTEDLADEQTEIRNERILYDRTHHFSLYEHLDEKQNLVRELLTEDTSTLYTVDEQSGQCQATKIEPIRASEAYLPLHDIRMLFTLWPNAFESTFDFYELGKADERDVFCSIREAVLPVPRSKFNSLKAEYAVVTHYVPTSSFFGTSLSLKLPVNIPISIRIEFFSDIKLTRSLGNHFFLF